MRLSLRGCFFCFFFLKVREIVLAAKKKSLSRSMPACHALRSRFSVFSIELAASSRHNSSHLEPPEYTAAQHKHWNTGGAARLFCLLPSVARKLRRLPPPSTWDFPSTTSSTCQRTLTTSTKKAALSREAGILQRLQENAGDAN